MGHSFGLEFVPFSHWFRSRSSRSFLHRPRDLRELAYFEALISAICQYFDFSLALVDFSFFFRDFIANQITKIFLITQLRTQMQNLERFSISGWSLIDLTMILLRNHHQNRQKISTNEDPSAFRLELKTLKQKDAEGAELVCVSTRYSRGRVVFSCVYWELWMKVLEE